MTKEKTSEQLMQCSRCKSNTVKKPLKTTAGDVRMVEVCTNEKCGLMEVVK